MHNPNNGKRCHTMIESQTPNVEDRKYINVIPSNKEEPPSKTAKENTVCHSDIRVMTVDVALHNSY